MEMKSLREWRKLYEAQIAAGADYVNPIRLVQLSTALIEDLERETPKETN